MPETEQQNAGSADEATQGGEAARDFSWVEATIWTKRMLSALVNGVKGGKWYALMDKAFAPRHAGGGLDEGPGQQRRGGRGWAEHRTVRGSGGFVSGRAVSGAAGGLLPPASRQTSRNSEGRWQDEAVGDSAGRGSHRATGGTARDRTD